MPLTKFKLSSIADGGITEAKIATAYTASVKTNPEFQGTEGARLPNGTTAQRANAKTGDQRFNSTLSLMEYYDGSAWKSIDSPPVVSSISPTTETDANANIVITGSNFQSGATVKFIGNDGTEYNSPSVTVNSSTQVTATTPASALTVANEPYDIKLTNTSSLSVTLADALDAGSTPTWTTSAGNIGTIYEDIAIGTLAIAATDADGDAVSITSSDFSISGVSLATGGAITGTPNVNDSYASGGVTHTFSGAATDGVNTATRSFNIIRKWNDGSTSAQAAPSGVAIYDLTGTTSNGTFWIKPAAYAGSAIECYVWMENSSYGRGAVLAGSFAGSDSAFEMRDHASGRNESSAKNYHTTAPGTNNSAVLNKLFFNALVRDSSGNHTWGGTTSHTGGNGQGTIFQLRDRTNNAKGTTGNSGFDAWTMHWLTSNANNNAQLRYNTDARNNVGWTTQAFHNTRSFSFNSWFTFTGGRSTSVGSYHYMPDDETGGGEWQFRDTSNDSALSAYGASALSNIYIW
jgi:hypothetical protein